MVTIQCARQLRRSLSRLNGTTRKFPDMPAASVCQICMDSRAYGLLQRGRALLHSSNRRELAPLPTLRLGFPSASTTTRSSTRPRTSNTSPGKTAHGSALNWRYDSGLVAGATPCFGITPDVNNCPGSVLIGGAPNVSMIASNVGGVPLSADQEFEAGFTCNGVHATPTAPLPYNCSASQFGSSLIKVPAPGTENDDHNPPRIASRNLFDLSSGMTICFMAKDTNGVHG